jgi:hypothetical protein
MRFGVRRVAFGIAVSAIVACSLTDLTGFSDGAEPDRPDVFVADAAPANEAAAADAASEVAQPCKASAVLDTPLTTNLGTWTPYALKQKGHPNVESFFGTSAGVLLPFVDTTPIPIDAGDPDAGPTFDVPPQIVDAVSALWHTTPIPLRAFDVSYEAHVRCTNGGSCADGLVFAWLATASPAVLTTGNSGGTEGIPSGVAGIGVLLDDYKNNPNESNDPASPSIQIVKIDPTKPALKSYPWVVASKGVSFLGAWHTVGISVRGDAVTVRFDGAIATTTTLPSIPSGLVGLTAGTGGESDAVAVRNFKGSFYDCIP